MDVRKRWRWQYKEVIFQTKIWSVKYHLQPSRKNEKQNCNFFWSIVFYANYKTCVGIIFWQEDFSRWYTSSFSNQFKSKALTYKGVNMFLYKRASLLFNLGKDVTIFWQSKLETRKKLRRIFSMKNELNLGHGFHFLNSIEGCNPH